MRWEDVYREIRAADGSVITITAEITADGLYPIGSILWKGSITDIPGTAFAPTTGLVEIVKFNGVPDIKGRATLFKLSCQLYRGSLPAYT